MQHDLNDMAVFAKVVGHRGFSAAAEVVGLPKSNVSRRVSRLEERLGVRLLERTTRKLHLTEVGEIYYRHCQRILEEAEHADLCVNRLLETPRGLLRISASVSTGQHLLAPIISDFMAQHPAVQVQLVLANRQVDVIEEGFDLVIRIGRLEDSSLVARGLGRSQLYLYASPAYLKRRDTPRDPDDLKNHDCLVMSDLEGPNRWQLVNADHRKTLTLQARAIINDFTTLRQIMLDGGGIAILPSYMCDDDQRQNKILRVLPGWSFPPVEFHALYPSHRGATPKVRAFLDFLVDRIAYRFNSHTRPESSRT